MTDLGTWIRGQRSVRDDRAGPGRRPVPIIGEAAPVRRISLDGRGESDAIAPPRRS